MENKCAGGKVLFSIKQVVGGGDGSHTPGTAAGQRHRSGQLHPNIVIVVITIVIFVIIIVIIIFVNIVTIVIVILISKSMEIVSGMVLFQILFRWHSVWNCFRYLNGDPESWAVLFANVESSLLKKKLWISDLDERPLCHLVEHLDQNLDHNPKNRPFAIQ